MSVGVGDSSCWKAHSSLTASFLLEGTTGELASIFSSPPSETSCRSLCSVASESETVADDEEAALDEDTLSAGGMVLEAKLLATEGCVEEVAEKVGIIWDAREAGTAAGADVLVG